MHFRKKVSNILIYLLFLSFVLQGCGRAVVEESVEVSEAVAEETVVEYVEKEEPKEATVEDNIELYGSIGDDSVIKMYLTTYTGNAADGTNHTWTEINSHSAYYYDDLGVDRYKVDGVLQIDDGNGINSSSFGYEEKTPNVSVQVRGQTSSRSDIKNYKIRIKNGKGEFRGQRTLNLNKHLGDSYRIINKTCYDMLSQVPQLIAGRTQFVQLFVKDDTEGGNGEYVDYGLYTMVEQVNKTYLKSRNLDSNGQLYKVTFFEWNKYEEVATPVDSPDFDLAEFEKYLEVKGNKDNSKINDIVEKVNNRMIPIDEIVAEHFDAENICYWMAFNILVGNYDSGARNLFLYSPLNSEKFYFICWDLDASMRRTYIANKGVSEGSSWERGMSQYLGLVLVNRMLKETKYRKMLDEAIEDLHDNYVNGKIVDNLVYKYREVARPFLYGGADTENAKLSLEDFEWMTEKLGVEVEDNYQYYMDTRNKPWPFFVGLPEVDDNEMIINWDASYDINGEAVTYDYILARDYNFTDVISSGTGLTAPSVSVNILKPGVYFMRVISTNESGESQDCFDYYSSGNGNKVYACMAFEVLADGSAQIYTRK